MAWVPFHRGLSRAGGPPGDQHLPRELHRALPLPPQGLWGEHRLLTRLQALEKRFEVLEAEVSQWELQRGAAAVASGGEPPPGDILTLLEGLMSRRDAGLKEHLRTDVTNHLQVRGVGGMWGDGGMQGQALMFPRFSPCRVSWMPSEPRCRGI